MRKLSVAVGVVVLLSTLGILAAQQEQVTNDDVSTTQQIRLARTYSVKDLPVWTQSGNFEPEILISLLRSQVKPDRWQEDDRIVPYAATAALVVSAAGDVHETIADVLEDLRTSK